MVAAHRVCPCVCVWAVVSRHQQLICTHNSPIENSMFEWKLIRPLNVPSFRFYVCAVRGATSGARGARSENSITNDTTTAKNWFDRCEYEIVCISNLSKNVFVSHASCLMQLVPETETLTHYLQHEKQRYSNSNIYVSMGSNVFSARGYEYDEWQFVHCKITAVSWLRLWRWRQQPARDVYFILAL